MARRSLACLGAILALILGACSQSSETFGTSSPGDSSQIDGAGGRVELAGGVVVEAVAGTFDSATSFTLTPSGSAPLPDGATAVGAAVTITASTDPTAPVIIGLPLPDGTAPEDLVMLHTDDAGEQQLLGGWVEDGTLFAASAGFSRLQAVEYRLEDALAGVTSASAIPAAFQEVLSGKGPGFGEEWLALARGSLERPAHRTLQVIGPGEIAVGQTTSFVAAGFDALAGQFVEYSWSVHGSGLSLAGAGANGGVTVEATAVGRAVLTVEARDPLTGAVAFGSLRVFGVQETTLTIVALPMQSLCFEEADIPTVMAYFEGGTPPYRWAWAWEDGVERSGEGSETTAQHGPISADITLSIAVVDAAGVEAETTIAVRGLPGYRSDAAAYLAGPFTGEVGQELTYRILSWNAESGYTLPFQALLSGAAGVAAVDGEVVRVTFDEPGWGLITLADSGNGIAQARPWITPVRVTGQTPPAEARLTAASPRATVNVPLSFQVEARGGVVAGLDEGGGYTAEVNFDDGTVLPVPIPATSALEWSGADVEHAWAEAGTYTVTLTATTPDGQTAEATAEVEVTGELRAVGKFQIAEIPGLEVESNRVVLLVSGSEVTIDRYQLHTVYQVMRFELGPGGETVSVPTDCTQESEMRLTSADLALEPGSGRISGTVTVRDLMDMTGPECPFGGGSRDVIRQGEAEGTFAAGVITLTLRFPTIPEAAEAAYQIVATVRQATEG